MRSPKNKPLGCARYLGQWRDGCLKSKYHYDGYPVGKAVGPGYVVGHGGWVGAGPLVDVDGGVANSVGVTVRVGVGVVVPVL